MGNFYVFLQIHFGSLAELIFYLPPVITAGIIFWFARMIIQKIRLRGDYKERRRTAILHEIILTLFFCWCAFIFCALLAEAYLTPFFMKLYDGKNPFKGMDLRPIFGFPPNFVPSIFRGDFDLEHMLLNAVLFMPFGVLVPFLMKKPTGSNKTDFPEAEQKQNASQQPARRNADFVLLKVTLMGFAASFLVEFVQYFVGREPDIDDLIANTLGAFLGCLIFVLIRKLFPKFTEKCRTAVK